MKKKLALILLTLLAAALVLTACSQAEVTGTTIRWESEETHVFDISLADFDNADNAPYPFKQYGDNTYYRDVQIATSAARETFDDLDEIRPEAAHGTYTLSIIRSGDTSSYCVVEGKQLVYLRYFKSDVDKLDNWSALQSAVVSGEENPFGDSADYVTLKSQTNTYVRFDNNPVQRPQASSTEVDGFYLGKLHQEVSKYKVSSEYDFSESKPIVRVSINGGEPTEHKLSKSVVGRLIDSNQVLMYVRSLNKSSTDFQDSPFVYVFSPIDGTVQTATFGFTYSQNVLLNDESRHVEGANEDAYQVLTKVNAVGVSIGSIPFMMQMNLSDQMFENNLDVLVGTPQNSPKYTTVRFRVGFLSYELAQYNDDIWQQLHIMPSDDAN